MRECYKIKWLDTSECDPPHRVSHEDKLIELSNEFARQGWSQNHPVLIGYTLEGRVQLLSGTHRHRAAELNDMRVPVLLRSLAHVQAAWGDTDQWAELMQAPLLRRCVTDQLGTCKS